MGYAKGYGDHSSESCIVFMLMTCIRIVLKCLFRKIKSSTTLMHNFDAQAVDVAVDFSFALDHKCH